MVGHFVGPEICGGASIVVAESNSIGNKIVRIARLRCSVIPIDSNDSNRGGQSGGSWQENGSLPAGNRTENRFGQNAACGAGGLFVQRLLVDGDEVGVEKDVLGSKWHVSDVGCVKKRSFGHGPESELGCFLVGGQKSATDEELSWVVVSPWS